MGRKREGSVVGKGEKVKVGKGERVKPFSLFPPPLPLPLFNP
jgi:hypothetical protein